MAFLVVGYPKLSNKDFAWIQAYRKINDPRYFSVVEPHFTIVFPMFDMPKAKFIDETKRRIQNLKAFKFELNVATVNQDDSGEYYHEFLVPDTGYSDIVKIHDKLYSGTFSKNLRLDIDFIPHIGIGNSDDATTSKRRVDSLNDSGVHVTGQIDSLDVIEFNGGPVKTLEKIGLG